MSWFSRLFQRRPRKTPLPEQLAAPRIIQLEQRRVLSADGIGWGLASAETRLPDAESVVIESVPLESSTERFETHVTTNSAPLANDVDPCLSLHVDGQDDALPPLVGSAGNDRLVVKMVGQPTDLETSLTVHGGAGTNDVLVLTGGSFNTVRYLYDSARPDCGAIQLDG